MLHIPYVAGGSVRAVYNQISGALVYGPLFGQVWLKAMNKDKGGDAWMQEGGSKDKLPVLLFSEFLLNLGKVSSCVILTYFEAALSQLRPHSPTSNMG
ncbi:hypothetical protein BGZ72_006932 [Mortierella alpina]|nr:hypothetical protein BGZ72_006932 [Mortierella alpina]